MGSINRVFVYGTLKRNRPNYHLLENPREGFAQFVGDGTTVDCFPLVIASRYNLPYLLKSPGLGKNIKGEIYEVDDKCFDALDKLERYPDYYDRQQIQVKLNSASPGGSSVTECWCYMLANFKPYLLELPHIQDFDASFASRFVWHKDRLPYSEYDPKDDVCDR